MVNNHFIDDHFSFHYQIDDHFSFPDNYLEHHGDSWLVRLDLELNYFLVDYSFFELNEPYHFLLDHSFFELNYCLVDHSFFKLYHYLEYHSFL